ncbi:alpha/beta hydrolase [Dethiosulfovibrio sp. F2B]|uniref:alpha/beta hydrolase n=1 Tax=Dethiosulfovibrio faecalis TaxID=2720018 RepID=UPI001F28D5A8|nr:alpha/beta hydrolase [Dethiosulfovibrio faecalis]MCF4151637.1 alpha/beta hydrolase [Dethiosulfovibrio faecalis]
MSGFYVDAPGSYGDRSVRIEVLEAPKGSPWVVCLFHGVYGVASLEEGNKYGDLARRLSERGITTCLVETSRDERNRSDFPDRSDWAYAAFSGKKYGQELFDHMSGLSKVSELFPDGRICLWGFSLGGIDSLMIAGGAVEPVSDLGLEVPSVPLDRVEALVISGSGDTLRSGSSIKTSLPVLSSICEPEVLREACRNVEVSSVDFFYGSEDDTFDELSCRRLFDLISVSSSYFTVIDGADHPFRSLDGVPSTQPLDLMAETVSAHLQGQPGDCPR